MALYIFLIALVVFAIVYTQISYISLIGILKEIPLDNLKIKVGSDIFVNGSYKGKEIKIRISRSGRCYVPTVNFEISTSLPFEVHIFRSIKQTWLGFGYERIKVGNEEFDSKYFVEAKKEEASLARDYLALRQVVIDDIFQGYKSGLTKPWTDMIIFEKTLIDIKIVNFSYKTLTLKAITEILNLMEKLSP